MKQELLDAQRRLSDTVTDVDQWSPHAPNINAFDSSELQSMYGQSLDMMTFGQAVFEAATERMEGIVDKFKANMGLLESEAYELEQQLGSTDSQTRAAATYALEKNLTAQALAGKDTREGSAISRQQQAISSLGEGGAAVAGQAAAMQSQEDLGKRADYYTGILNNNQSMINALQGQAGAAQGMATQGGALERQGLDSVLKAEGASIQNKLALMSQSNKFSGMKADALRAKLGSASSIHDMARSRYTSDEIKKLDLDRRKEEYGTKKLAAGISAAVGGTGFLSTLGKKGKKIVETGKRAAQIKKAVKYGERIKNIA